jgi:histidyl-tRNA synthetase
MIYEHEIPKNSRLYFGKSAKLKREIENISSKVLESFGYEEIVTPILSYHQHNAVNEKELIRFSDERNNIISLRADSTLDVVRLITKRLGRSVKNKKWFYIQQVFRYPSSEIYQVGAEYIGSDDLSEPIKIVIDIYEKLDLKPTLHICNINIPKIISKDLGLPISVFEAGNLEEILKINVQWLNKLACLQFVDDIKEVIKIAPKNIKEELEKMYILSKEIEYENILFSPLYYAKMRYYDDLFFRFFDSNKTLCIGGYYKFKDIQAVGFAEYLDAIIEVKGSMSNE